MDKITQSSPPTRFALWEIEDEDRSEAGIYVWGMRWRNAAVVSSRYGELAGTFESAWQAMQQIIAGTGLDLRLVWVDEPPAGSGQ